MANVIWPETLTRQGLVSGTTEANLKLCADALEGWALVMDGYERPPYFGEGMAQIGMALGITAIPEELDRLSQELLEKLDREKTT